MDDSVKELRKNARIATGTMTATVRIFEPGNETVSFEAQEMYFAFNEFEVAVLGGIDFDETNAPYIIVSLPSDFEGPTHPVMPPENSVAHAFIHNRRTGYAQSGEVTNAFWDKDAKIFSGNFTFAGQDQSNSGHFEVLDGEFSVQY